MSPIPVAEEDEKKLKLGINELTKEFKQVFDTDASYLRPLKNSPPMRIKVSEEGKKNPFRAGKPRPVPFAIRPEALDEIEMSISTGVIERIHPAGQPTPWLAHGMFLPLSLIHI